MSSESTRIAVARESARYQRQPRVGGRLGVLAYALGCVAEGRGWPAPAQIAAIMGWRSERSVRDALAKLERDGFIRKAGRASTWGRRNVYEITAKGVAPISTWTFSRSSSLPATFPMAAAA